MLAVGEKASGDTRSLSDAGQVRITDLDGLAIFSSLEAGDYYVRIEMEGALRQMIGPIPIGEKCVRLPGLRVIVLFYKRPLCRIMAR